MKTVKIRTRVNGDIQEWPEETARQLIAAGIWEAVEDERSEAQDEPAAQQTDAPAVRPRKRKK